MQIRCINIEVTFRSYNRHLQEKYGRKAYRVAVDAGFSCPHRGENRTNPGCTFCDKYGSMAPYQGSEPNLRNQVNDGIRFLKKRYGAEVFLLYFQPYSNTFASVSTLNRIYDLGLSLAPFRELIVATRPDCINREKAELLASYRREDLEVWVELGLQSTCDRTLLRVNRGHTAEDFFDAYRMLKLQGLKIAVHLMFGLPGETWQKTLETVREVAALDPDGVKIHNLHIAKNTALYEEFLRGELTAPGSVRHLTNTIQALEYLPAHTVIMRLTCDTPASRLAAPRAFWEKSRFYNVLRGEMKRRNACQGRLFRGRFTDSRFL